MSTSRNTWKARERAIAAELNCKRSYGSGSCGRSDQTRSDTYHPRLFVECKLRAKSAVWALWDKTHKLSTKEKKTPVLAIVEKHRHGHLWVVHKDEMDIFVREWLVAQDDDIRNRVLYELDQIIRELP